MLQYSERVSVQQKCDFPFFFSVDDCVWGMSDISLMGRRGTVAQGTLGHCSGHSWHFQQCLVLPCAWSCVTSPFSSPQRHPLFLWFTAIVWWRLSVPWVPQEAAGCPVPLLWAVGSETCTGTWRRNQSAWSKFSPFGTILVCICVYPWKLTWMATW